ncbi:outer membrane beta-barrel protein [Flagellimonas sp.]|uniref:outer membrane beta-barrel protein n=1 Tax=Flagellimonas sp. TaxID=2058762 RepID=UPI003B51C814
MKNIITLLPLLLLTTFAKAQNDRSRFINAQIGYGLSAPYHSVDEVVDDGFFVQGEYGGNITSWLQTKGYLGLILTRAGMEDLNGNPTNEGTESRAFLVGAKARLRAPIPWVSPYAEIGIGTSIGNFVTYTGFTNIRREGIVYHIPFSVGLLLGPKNSVDLGLMYYFQPDVEQYVGAFAVGLSIPLKNK